MRVKVFTVRVTVDDQNGHVPSDDDIIAQLKESVVDEAGSNQNLEYGIHDVEVHLKYEHDFAERTVR